MTINTPLDGFDIDLNMALSILGLDLMAMLKAKKAIEIVKTSDYSKYIADDWAERDEVLQEALDYLNDAIDKHPKSESEWD